MKFQEKKDNKKLKQISIIVIIAIILITAITGVIIVINKSKENYELEKISNEDINYYKIMSNGKSGIIDKTGKVIIEPKYNTIKLPNPKEPIFICIYDYNAVSGEYKTKVLNEKNEEILKNYENVNTIDIKEVVSSIPYEKTVLQYQKDGKYGIINFEGKSIIKPIYEEIRNMPYREGELIVKKQGKYGVVSINGGKLLDCKYDYITGDNYYSEEKKYELDGYIVGINNEDGKMQYGYINNKREQILDVEFDKIYRMNDVKDDENIYLLAEKDGKIQLYKNNKLLLDNNYQSINYSEDSKLLILQKDGRYGVTDLNGKQILSVDYEQIRIPGDYIIAIKDGKQVIFDLVGTQKENLAYTNILKTENENYNITVDKNDKYGVINKDGNILIGNKYNYIQYLYDNYFIVGGETGKSGIINDKGEEILPIKYEVIQKLDKNNIVQAMVGNVLELYSKEMNNIVSMENGKIEINDEYIKVYSNNQTTYVSNDGTLKTNFEIFNNNIFASEREGKWGFVDKDNNVVVDYQYDKVTEVNELGFAGIKKDGKWGVIDGKANIILEPTYKIPEQNGEPYFIGKYYKVISGYEIEYFTDDINEQ
ncbi:MAG: WG repeat-containing protein [Clostridia bacterium]